MPRHADRVSRWASLRFIGEALRAYVDGKPLRMTSQPDWPLVVEHASRQMVSPTIGLALTRQPDVPDDVKDYFAALIALNRQRNAVLEKAICELIAALNQAGMTPLFLKGTANLLSGLHRDPAARFVGDIDVLVPPDRVKAAAEVLATIGYPAVEEPPLLPAAPAPPQPKRRYVTNQTITSTYFGFQK